MSDPFDLQRFVAAQDAHYPSICAELRAGRKESHWMWYVFPQLSGLGKSAMAQRYGLSSLAEARAYLQHPVLGTRLRQCTGLVNAVPGASIRQILGSPDDLKFRSCVTLFSVASGREALFEEALRKYYAGASDTRTLELLGAEAP